MSTRALAVCYRNTSAGTEVLLVRSRRGSGWTIPGGRVDPGETPEHAALRELQEEAGVVGTSAGAPVAYVSVIKNVRDVLRLGAARTPVFLVRTEAGVTSDERWRTPTWFSPLDARVALADGRMRWAPRWRLAALDAAVAHLQP
jgi:8-oxo-dGTP pyrophosphatase MutT (NUDIX family)